MKRFVISSWLALLAVMACADDEGLVEPHAGLLVWRGESVRIEAHGCQGLVGIENQRDDRIFFDIVGREAIPEWRPCTNDCRNWVDPGEIGGLQFEFDPPPDRIEWAVFWWHLVSRVPARSCQANQPYVQLLMRFATFHPISR